MSYFLVPIIKINRKTGDHETHLQYEDPDTMISAIRAILLQPYRPRFVLSSSNSDYNTIRPQKYLFAMPTGFLVLQLIIIANRDLVRTANNTVILMDKITVPTVRYFHVFPVAFVSSELRNIF